MQKVACPTMIVKSPSSTPNGSGRLRNVAFSAIPVTIPGNASGRMTRKEMPSRPKKRWRATANATHVPSRSAIAVAPSAAFNDTRRASRTPGLSIALPNHFVVRPGIGHTSVRRGLNAYRTMTSSGR